MGGRPFFEFPTKLRFLMRFNPLWLIVLLFLLPGAGLLFLPLLIFAALPLLLGLAGGGAFARAPGQLWALVKNARVRANFVLAHAAARVLGERYGVAPICWSGETASSSAASATKTPFTRRPSRRLPVSKAVRTT